MMDRDKSLLFGVIAVQLKKVTPWRFTQAAEEWAKDPSRDLGQYLVGAGALSEDDRALVQGLVDEAVRHHGGDPEATLDALGGGQMVGATFGDSFSVGPNAATVAGAAPPESIEQIPAVQEQPGRYTHQREYASGGMGRILLVHDRHFGRDIALKELLPDQLLRSGTRGGALTSDMLTIPAYARFVQEAKITGQLEHPSIVPVYELGYRPDGSLYYTMRLVRGRTLQDAMIEAGSLRGRLELLTHFLDLCQAVSYAHSRGVVHRDIKPKNVMVGEFGETVVIDWGIAKVRGRSDIHAKELHETYEALHEGGEATVKTLYGQALGSPYFMPPEQALGKIDKIDERSDVYSLGAVLYTLLTGQLPFLGSTSREFLKKVLADPPKPVLEIEANAPRELVAVCERAMQKDPGKRYQTAKELTDEVHRFLSGGLVQAYDYGYRELVGRFVRKHKTFLVTAGSALLVLLAVCFLSYFQVVKEKRIALEQRNAATRAKLAAEEARKKEEAMRVLAEEAREKEQAAKQEAQQELYSSNIALSERCLMERRLAPARSLLAGCPESYRQWEWGRLQYLCNADIMTLKSGGYSAAFLPDGIRMILSTVDGAVTLGDSRTGDTVRTFVERAGFGTVVAVNADGARVAVNGDEFIAVWEIASGADVFTWKDVEPAKGLWPHCMVFSSDGSRLAARVDAKLVKLWDVNSGQELGALPLERNSGFRMAFSPDGRLFLTCAALFGAAGWENVFALHETDTGKEISRHALPAQGFVHALDFSPDGAQVLLGTDVSVSVWDYSKWKKRTEFPAQVYYPQTVRFNPDCRLVAAAGKDGTLVVWDIAAGAEVLNAKAHLDAVHAVAFSPDGGRVATASFDRTAKLWSIAEKRVLKELVGHTGQVFCVAFSPDGSRLVTGDYDGTTKLWAIDSDLELTQADTMDFCPSRTYVAGSDGNNIKLWDSHTGRVIRTFQGHGGRVTQVAFDPDGKRLASVAREATAEGGTYTVKLWDVDAGTELCSFAVPLPQVKDLVFSPNGRLLAIRGGSTLRLWNLDSGQEDRTVEDLHGFQFSPDGVHLVTGTPDGVLLLWDLLTGTAPTELRVVTKGDLCLAFSPDSALLAAGNDDFQGNYEGGVVLWNVTDGRKLLELYGHESGVTCAAFSPDCKRLATGSKDRQARLWDIENRRELFTFEGHAGEIRFLLFSGDGKRLVTASLDGTFKLWDCESGRELITLQNAAQKAKEGNVSPSRAVFTPDGRQLVTFTEPIVLPPVVLHSFPWNLAEYPGAPETPLQERVETYKRQYWSALNAATQ
jgi:WD40 repeat protein/tRNA A-37 threonylcarbamoyl transferase component Bud32